MTAVSLMQVQSARPVNTFSTASTMRSTTRRSMRKRWQRNWARPTRALCHPCGDMEVIPACRRCMTNLRGLFPDSDVSGRAARAPARERYRSRATAPMNCSAVTNRYFLGRRIWSKVF